MKLQITQWWMQDVSPGTELPEPVFQAGDGSVPARWTPVELPANLIQLLVRQGRLPDPYVDANTEAARWTEERDWWFAADVARPEGVAPWQRLILRFQGVEPGTRVWLNGRLLGEHPSALRPAEWDVTDHLQPGRNRLVVRIPALGELPAKARTLWAPYDQRRVLRREPQMRYGWDWGPRLVMAGIWRPVELVARGAVHLDGGVAVRTVQIRPDAASLELVAQVAGPVTPGTRLRVRLDGQERVLPVHGGIARGMVEVAHPRLWWTHDLGRPELYTLEAVLESPEGHELDRYTTRFGIRQVHLVQAPDGEGGLSFRLFLNGVPLFARGANWIPAESMLGAAPPERYRRLLTLAREGNMNMIRVWGGGMYEDPVFYETCDELGLLVWQDFIFACAEYPDDDPAFVREVEAEAAWAVKRLRNHPSIALWCGNNENDWIASQNTWEEPGRAFPGYRIYHQVLPAVCAALDPTRPYWPSSPYGGDDPNADEMGNKHNWQVWHGGVYPRRSHEPPRHDPSPEGVNFRRYQEDWGRFVTEFGIHGSPRLSLLRRYVTGPLTYNGEAFLNRIKDPNGNVKIEQLFAYHTGQPRDIEAYEELSTLVQAEGMRVACEHYRAREPLCSGALVWQLNDCWPGISWSLIDYGLHPKPAYYAVRRAFEPRAVFLAPAGTLSPFDPPAPPGTYELVGVNSLPRAWKGRIEVGRMDFTGRVLARRELEVELAPSQATRLGPAGLGEEGLTPAQRRSQLLYVRVLGGEEGGRSPGWATRLWDPGAVPARPPVGGVWLLAEEKELVLPDPELTVERREDGLRLRARHFAHFVRLTSDRDDLRFADNGFDLLPGEERFITVTSEAPWELEEVQVKVRR